MPTTTETKPVPPPAAVAADAHWAAKMQRLRDRQLPEAVFVVCDDQDVRTRYQRAQRSLDAAQAYVKDHPDDTQAAADTVTAQTTFDEAKTAYDQVSIPLLFRALPRKAFEELLKQHLPSEAEADEGKEWADSFHAALISAASVDGMTETEAQELLDTWSLAEANSLFNSVWGLHQTVRADLGKG